MLLLLVSEHPRYYDAQLTAEAGGTPGVRHVRRCRREGK
jgi:hypothetical protein